VLRVDDVDVPAEARLLPWDGFMYGVPSGFVHGMKYWGVGTATATDPKRSKDRQVIDRMMKVVVADIELI